MLFVDPPPTLLHLLNQLSRCLYSRTHAHAFYSHSPTMAHPSVVKQVMYDAFVMHAGFKVPDTFHPTKQVCQTRANCGFLFCFLFFGGAGGGEQQRYSALINAHNRPHALARGLCSASRFSPPSPSFSSSFCGNCAISLPKPDVLLSLLLLLGPYRALVSFARTRQAELSSNRMLFRRFKQELKSKYPGVSRRCY